jgi:flavin-dependent dehydrogenase
MARRGRAVLLVDRARFPRYKVCGGCLNARALSALEAAGLGDLVESLGGVPLRNMRMGLGGRTARLRLPNSVALSREAFDNALARAARDAGAEFLPETSAFVCSPDDGGRNVRLHAPDATLDTRARLVIAADGLGGRLFRAQGFNSPSEEGSRVGAGVVADLAPDEYEPGTVHMAWAPGAYVGLVRVEDGRLNIAAAFDVTYLRDAGGMGPAAVVALKNAGFPAVPNLTELPWRGTPALTRRATLVSAPRAFVLGDAAGYVEPFTGEGMAWALTSALALAPIADRALDRPDSAVEQEWSATYDSVVRRRQYICRLIASGLRRPRLMRTAVRVVSTVPGAAKPFLKHINLPFTQEGFA